MGLRINTNVGALTALRALRSAGSNTNRSIERLATGLRITSASDDPSGMVIGQRLRAQVQGFAQAIENSQNASNLIGTAEAAVGEIYDLLIEVREAALASLAGGDGTVAAEQDTVDNAIAAIERIASTTRYGNRPLLSGSGDFTVTKDADITELNLRQVQFYGGSQVSYDLNVTQAAEQAYRSGVSGVMAVGGEIQLEVRGSLGVETISLAAGASAADLRNAVNQVRGNTGIYASGSNIYSEEFGTDATISINQTGGAGAYAGQTGVDTGLDVEGNLNGMAVTGRGRLVSVTTPGISGNLTVDTDVTAGDSLNFTVQNSGYTFQLGPTSQPADRITLGFQSMNPDNLGSPEVTLGGQTVGGYLSSILAGGANDLFNNPENALNIVDAALEDVSKFNASLGAVEAFTIQPNIETMEIGYQELSQSLSTIMDLDYARELSALVQSQVMMEASVYVLGQANSSPTMVLNLMSANGY